MIIQDAIYGNLEIKEPTILELINSKTLQRLKGIDQGGYSKPFFPYYFTRWEHSIGVYFLLKKYQASFEEQVAGLIHDVSHSCFSHCIDYVLTEGSAERYDHQDNIFYNYVLWSDIPKILKKYKLDVAYILNEKNFPLKEKEIPDLCADRIDYSLRTAVHVGGIDKTWVSNILSKLKTKNNQWVFTDKQSAGCFARLFLKLNKKHYAGFNSARMFSGVGDWLAYALSRGYINYKDLYTTDKQVIQKISKYNKKDKKLALFWERLNNPRLTRNNSKDYNKKVIVKSRIVDPLFLNSTGEVVRFSQTELSWKAVVKKELKPKEYWLEY